MPTYPRNNRKNVPYYLTNLGVACLNRGKIKWATGLFEQVASAFPGNKRAAQRIKDALKKSKRS